MFKIQLIIIKFHLAFHNKSLPQVSFIFYFALLFSKCQFYCFYFSQ